MDKVQRAIGAAQGPRGRKGARGARGPVGPAASQADILAVVDNQLSEIRNQLTVQMTRTGQIQAELDRARRDTTQLHDQVERVQATLKRFMGGLT